MPIGYPSTIKSSKMNTKGTMKFKPKVEYSVIVYAGENGQDEGYHQEFTVTDEHNKTSYVEIYPPARDIEGNKIQWEVLWDGALDFDGNKRDLLKRYPEFRGKL